MLTFSQILTDGKNDFRTWTRWGRVGENGQNALLGNGTFDDALKNYDKKFKDKTGLKWDDRTGNPKSGKYVYVERNYEPDSDSEDAEKDSGDVKEEETEDSKAEKVIRFVSIKFIPRANSPDSLRRWNVRFLLPSSH